MSLAEILQSKIATKQEGDRQSRHRVYEKTEDVVKMLRQATTTSTNTPFQPISLDMFIAFREEFHSGWNLWLGDDEVATLPPNLKELFSAMTFDEKKLKFFRLTLWTKNKKRALDYEDITDIPDGAEEFVERVTGLSLFDDKMAQGNASKIEIVTRVGVELLKSTLQTPKWSRG
ncbi:Hypothetical protein PHPALM_6005 [Phytophthora palmivora]|uniref:Uncharacterized protein n=1 Tax=Phytophthora palmivora TaxID=4796 RepID=A0A2P4YG09_9STRA|nr:Hypothetical protein PHPALM_6005 [Phytophthora palmivora]